MMKRDSGSFRCRPTHGGEAARKTIRTTLAVSALLILFIGLCACSINLYNDHSRRYVFVKNDSVSGFKQIFLSRDGDPKEFIVVKNPNLDCQGPVWSPDGLRIAYTEFDPIDTYQTKVCEVNGDGSGRNLLTRNPGETGYYPTWSPDGRKIAWLTDRLLVANVDGSDIQDIIPDLTIVLGPTNPSWSPDGRMIVLSANIPAIPPDPAAYGEIVVIDVYDKTYRRLTQNATTDDCPVWSPDGRKIAYLNNDQVVTCNLNGSGKMVLTTTSGDRLKPNWSPDGRKILFYSDRGHSGVYTLRIIGRDRINEDIEICDRDLNFDSDTPLTFSPDGTKILCATRYAPFEILNVRIDGGGYSVLKSSPDPLGNPAWSPR